MGYKSTIITLCSIAVVALLPPLAWHSRSKNIPAIILIIWLLIMNITCIVNAGIWSEVDFMSRWEGKGWCDIVIKLQVGANIGISCAVTNITYNLHQILKADSVIPDMNSWKKICIDLLISLLTPIMVMGFSYLLQVFRYGIVRYNGCQNLLSPTWITTVLYTMWMLIWSVIGAIYACLVLFVFYKKRKDVRDILYCTNSGLNITRFARLLIFCFIIILVMFPFSIFTFTQDLKEVSGRYDFKSTHRDVFWSTIIKVDHGKPMYSIWLYVLMSYLVFFIFGLGADALNMYSRFLRRIGLGFILDRFNMYVQKNKENKIGKLLGKLTDNTEYQKEYMSDSSGTKVGFYPELSTPVSTTNIMIDYSIPSSTNTRRNNHGRIYPFGDMDNDDVFTEKDLEMGNKGYVPYITEEYNFEDDISLDGFSRISTKNTKQSPTIKEKEFLDSPACSSDIDKSTVQNSSFDEYEMDENQLTFH